MGRPTSSSPAGRSPQEAPGSSACFRRPAYPLALEATRGRHDTVSLGWQLLVEARAFSTLSLKIQVKTKPEIRNH